MRFIAILFIAVFIAACSEDSPKPEFSVTGEFFVEDVHLWRTSQSLSFGAFPEGSKSPSHKIKLVNTGESKISLSLENIPQGKYELKVYLDENGIYKYDVYEYGVREINESVTLPDVNIKLVTFSRINTDIFNNCIQCHGGSSGEIAAGLNLLQDKSYTHLVNIQSMNSALLRVKPEFPKESFLINVLKEEGLTFEHPASSAVSIGETDLISDWISNGALND